MGYDSLYVLDWQALDMKRVQTAIEEAIRTCTLRQPLYAGTRIESSSSTGDSGSVNVSFPAALVQHPGWETDEPSEPAVDGFYLCTFEHVLLRDENRCRLQVRSNRSYNQVAWMTATKVLDAAGTILGATYEDE